MSEFRLSEDTQHRDALRDKARKIFVPSSPIRLRDQLRGREQPLDRALDALQTPGRSPFIYGDRGVGKTSLALIAAFAVNSSRSEPIYIACHPRITFGRLVAQIAKRIRDELGIGAKQKRTTELGLKTSLVSLLTRLETEEENLPTTVDPNDAVDLLDTLMNRAGSSPRVVVVDEVDTITDPTFRSDLAFFIKQLGDHGAQVKFIFAGIASNVQQLIAHHESAPRYLATIQLERLPLNVLKDIVVDGFAELDIVSHEPMAYRIACISDGFAHFTHLISLKLALAAINEQVIPQSPSSELLEYAIHESIRDTEALVKDAYDKAVQKYGSYEPVLWAVADHWEIYRSTRAIRASYERICSDLSLIPEERAKLSQMLNSLKRPSHGKALTSDRPSWFRIRESMLRGYCRMMALSKKIEVGLTYPV